METKEGMSNTTGIKWEMRYIQIYSTNSIPKTTRTERKYGTRELKPKIDHKISSAKGPKERCSKNSQKKERLEVAGNSIIVVEEIVTWDMR